MSGSNVVPRRGRYGRGTQTLVLDQPQLLAVPTQGNENDERYTPAWVFEALGVVFDVDVATVAGGLPWIPAERHWSSQDDGLSQEWLGTVWCNPPFSRAQAFAERFITHADGIGLFPLSQAKWVGPLLAGVDTLNIPVNIKFESPSHSGRHISFAVALVGVGPAAGNLYDLPGRTWSALEVAQ